MELRKFADSHVHMAEPGFGERYPDLGAAEILMTCTAKPDEWQAQMEIDDRRAVKSYGIHPWYAGQWTPETGEELAGLLEEGGHVGEIGLDSKRGTVREQVPAFEDQLRLASDNDRIATIHSIGTEKEVLDILRDMGEQRPRVILHSYGSDSYVKPYSEMGCYMSVSPRILSRSDVRVKRLLEKVPAGLLLLETDAPHYGRDFESMGGYVERLAGLMGTDPENLAGTVLDNMRGLLG